MRALTLHQPWASLIAEGHKKRETRGYPAPEFIIGKRIAIHAGKTLESGRNDRGWQNTIDELLGTGWQTLIPRGAIVATAVLYGTWECTMDNLPSVQERKLGYYTPGRHMWLLRDVEKLDDPIPCRGYQGFWRLGVWDQIKLTETKA